MHSPGLCTLPVPLNRPKRSYSTVGTYPLAVCSEKNASYNRSSVFCSADISSSAAACGSFPSSTGSQRHEAEEDEGAQP